MKNDKKQMLIIVGVLFSLVWIGVILWFTVFDGKASSDKKSEHKYTLYTVPEASKVFLEGRLQYSKSKSFSIDATKGRIDKILVSDQQSVRKGDVLFTYINEEAIEQSKDLRLQLEALVETQKQLDNQLSEIKSSNKVDIESQSPDISNSDELNILKNSSEESEKTIRNQLTENLNQQKRLNVQIINLDEKGYSNVTAPFSGTVSIENDNMRDEQSEILTLNSNKLRGFATVNEKDRGKINNNSILTVLIHGTGQELKGEITSIGNIALDAVDSSNGESTGLSQYPVYIKIPQQNNLYPGFHIQGSVVPKTDVPKIPKSAVLTLDDKSFVWEVESGKVRKTNVQVTEWNDKYVLVNEGLSQGKSIILKPGKGIKEGEKIDGSSD